MFFNPFTLFKEKVREKTDTFSDDEKILFNTMILGEKSYNSNVKEYFSSTGSSYFLSFSSIHLFYFFYVLDILLNGINEDTKKCIKVITLVLFNLMVGFKLSLLRASIMYVLSSFGSRRISRFKKIAISIAIIIFINPYVIFSSSFIFSFCIILGATTLSPFLFSYFNILLLRLFNLKYLNENFLKFSNLKKNTYYTLKYFLKSMAFSFSVQVITLPFQMYYFCEINFNVIFSNVIITPIMSFAMILGFFSFFLVYIPYVSDILFSSLKVVLSFCLYVTKIISQFSFFSVSTIKPDVLSIICYYLILAIFFYSKYLYKFFKVEKARRIKKKLKLVTVISVLYIIIIYVKVMYFEEYVYFFNVGQGNMAILHKNTETVVVDLGSTSEGVASNILISFLKAKNIKKIDMIIVTHMHDDHMNGVEEVLDNVFVSKVLFSNFENQGETKNAQFEKMVKGKGVSVVNISEGDNIIYKSFSINVLSPPKDKVISSSDILNSNSLVLLISKSNRYYLFMGDATKETEEYISYEDERLKKLSAFQVGHHGSSSSTSSILLDNISPCVAVISSKKKVYGHPTNETLEILKKYNFDVQITEEKGAIKVK